MVVCKEILTSDAADEREILWAGSANVCLSVHAFLVASRRCSLPDLSMSPHPRRAGANQLQWVSKSKRLDR